MRTQIMKRFSRSIPASVVMLTFVCWSISSSLFWHTHTTPSGRLVIHSHLFPPYQQKSSPGSTHDHSPLGFLFYHLNNPNHHLNYTPMLPVIVPAVTASLFLAPWILSPCRGVETADQIRAPPIARLQRAF